MPQINMRVSAEELAQIDARAAQAHKTRTRYILDAALDGSQPFSRPVTGPQAAMAAPTPAPASQRHTGSAQLSDLPFSKSVQSKGRLPREK